LSNYLIKNGAFINYKDSQNENVLFIAVREDNLEMTKMLLDNGIDVNVMNCDKESVLSLSEEFQQSAIHSLLKSFTENIPVSYECAVNGSSGIGVTSTIGTIDSSYVDDCTILIRNHIPHHSKLPKEEIRRTKSYDPSPQHCSTDVFTSPWSPLDPQIIHAMVNNLIV